MGADNNADVERAPASPVGRRNGALRAALAADSNDSGSSGACPAACVEKLTAMRQVRLALGRNAARVERVFVIDDIAAPNREALAGFEGLAVAVTPSGMTLPPGAVNDRAHIFLVDPRGNVMLRWPAKAEMKRMHRDLERLLKASQIG